MMRLQKDPRGKKKKPLLCIHIVAGLRRQPQQVDTQALEMAAQRLPVEEPASALCLGKGIESDSWLLNCCCFPHHNQRGEEAADTPLEIDLQCVCV